MLGDIAAPGDKVLREIDPDTIRPKSNLNSKVLKDICAALYLDGQIFVEEFDFIDRILVSRRNEIAHGEARSLANVDFKDMSDRTVQLMRKFRDEVENAALLGHYRAE